VSGSIGPALPPSGAYVVKGQEPRSSGIVSGTTHDVVTVELRDEPPSRCGFLCGKFEYVHRMPAHDPLREMRKFEAMRDALREAVTPGSETPSINRRGQRRRRPPSWFLRRNSS